MLMQMYIEPSAIDPEPIFVIILTNLLLFSCKKFAHVNEFGQNEQCWKR